MASFATKMIVEFFVAFGIVLGGSLVGGIGAMLIFQPPGIHMKHISESIKIWAMVAAVGGTIDPLRVIESHFLDGYLSPAIKQILYFISAFVGAHIGYTLVQWICKGSGEP